MDISQWLQPTVIIGLAGTVVALIIRAVRLQAQVDKVVEELQKLSTLVAKTEAIFSSHILNFDIHHSMRLQNEIEKRHDERFLRIEGRLAHLEKKIDD